MKTNSLLKILIFPALLNFILLGCKKEEVLNAGLPSIKVITVTDITTTSAVIEGEFVSDGGAPVKASGICFSSRLYPTLDNKTSDVLALGSFTSDLAGLKSNTVYFISAYVINNAGCEGFSNILSFKTLPDPGTPPDQIVTDIDGNVYKVAKFGSQTWMTENLKTTRYRNGDMIPNVSDDKDWGRLTTGAYCWYNNEEALYKAAYGALYNWFAVTDSRNIAPVGWHVPSRAEVDKLMSVLGNGGSDFTAFLGGIRTADRYGVFTGGLNEKGRWWNTDNVSSYAGGSMSYSLRFGWEVGPNQIPHDMDAKTSGLSIRCVKD